MPGRRSGLGSGSPHVARSGTTPAQASAARSSGGSSGKPSADLSDHSLIGSASTRVAARSFAVLRRTSVLRPGRTRSVKTSSARTASSPDSAAQRPNRQALR